MKSVVKNKPAAFPSACALQVSNQANNPHDSTCASKLEREVLAMKITELLIAELDHEAIGSRKALEHVPEGKNDWKPHEKSMPLGNLATIVATVPAWIEMVVKMDEIDINPVGGPKFKPEPWNTRSDLL